MVVAGLCARSGTQHFSVFRAPLFQEGYDEWMSLVRTRVTTHQLMASCRIPAPPPPPPRR